MFDHFVGLAIKGLITNPWMYKIKKSRRIFTVCSHTDKVGKCLKNDCKFCKNLSHNIYNSKEVIDFILDFSLLMQSLVKQLQQEQNVCVMFGEAVRTNQNMT